MAALLLMVAFLEGYRPHPAQARAHADQARFVACTAGTRGGKTEWGGAESLRRIYQDEQRCPGVDKLYWVVAPTHPIGSVAWRKLLDMAQSTWACGVAQQFRRDYRAARVAWPQRKGMRGLVMDRNKSTRQVWLAGSKNHGHGDGPSNILVEFRSTSDPESLVAAGLWGAWMDEAARCHAKAWSAGLRQRLADRQGWALFSTTPMGRNWYWSEIHQRGAGGVDADPMFSSHSWTTADNTAIPGLAAEVEIARAQLPERYFRREYEASFAAFQGQVYDEWSDAIHLRDPARIIAEPGYYDRIVGGLDFGWVHHGCLQVWGIREPRPRQPGEPPRPWRRSYTLLHERWEPHVEVVSDGDCWARTILEQHKRFGRFPVYCDGARPDGIYQLRQRGINAINAEKAVLDGIECVAKAMHPVNGSCEWFQVSRAARGMANDANAYRWATDKAGESTERPHKENDHAADTCRMAIYSDHMAHPMRSAA